MSDPEFHLSRLTAASSSLDSFTCGEETYDRWLKRSALIAVSAGTCAVYLLVRSRDGLEDVVGYFSIAPTQVVREELPAAARRGSPRAVPGWLIGKLALHVDLQGRDDWGTRLLVAAVEKVVTLADAGGGKVIVVDADNEGLVGFYLRHDFRRTGIEADGPGLRLFMKVSTARKALG